jgi:DNA repair exonuclease SbcCD ATPase subunit
MMSESVQVRNIQILSDLKQAFGRFAGEADQALVAIDAEIRRTLDWLQIEIDERRRILGRRQQELEEALDALADCRRSEDDADCGEEERELRRAERRLEEAEDSLKIAQRWKRDVESVIERFRIYITRFKDLATTQVSKGQGLLDRKLADLEKYQSVNSPAGTSFHGIVGSSGSLGGDSTGQWAEQGIQDVELASISEDLAIRGADDFQKVTMAEMRAGLEKLQKMLPDIKSGKGADKEYWRQIDQQQGLDYENGYQRVYESFYGDDAIRLTKIGDGYDITNGRHRIWVAKKMEIKVLPAKVIEKV